MPVAAAVYRLVGLQGNANWALYRPPSEPAYGSGSRSRNTEALESAAAPGAASSGAAAPGAAAEATLHPAGADAEITCVRAGAESASAATAAAARASHVAAASANPFDPAADGAAGGTGRAGTAASCYCTRPTGGGRAAAGGVEAEEEAATSSSTWQQVRQDVNGHATGEEKLGASQEQGNSEPQQQQQQQQEWCCGCVASRGREGYVSSSTCVHTKASAATFVKETCAPRQLLVVFLGDISDFFSPPSSSSFAAVQGQRQQQPQQQRRRQQEHRHEQHPGQTRPPQPAQQQGQHEQRQEEEEQMWQHEPQQSQQQQQQHQLEEQQQLEPQGQQLKLHGQQLEPQGQQQGQQLEPQGQQVETQGEQVEEQHLQPGQQQWEDEEEEEREEEDEEDTFCCSHYPYSLEGVFWILSSRFPTHALLLVRPAAVVRHHAVYRHFMLCDASGVPYSIEESLAFFRRHRSSGGTADDIESSNSLANDSSISAGENSGSGRNSSSSNSSSSNSTSNNSSSAVNGSSPSRRCSNSSTTSDRGNRWGTLKQGDSSTSANGETKEAPEGNATQPPEQQQQRSSPLSLSSAAGLSVASIDYSPKDEEEAVMDTGEQEASAPLANERDSELSLLQQPQQQQLGSQQAKEKDSAEEAKEPTRIATNRNLTVGGSQRSQDCSDPFSAAQHLVCLLNSLKRQLQQREQQPDTGQAVQQRQDDRERLPQQQRWHVQSIQQQQRHPQQLRLQQQQQQLDKEAQQTGQARGEVQGLRGEEAKQQREQERNGATTASNALPSTSVFADASSSSDATAARCCCGVVLDEFWQNTSITLLGFSKGAAVVLSCLRSKCRCWRVSTARNAIVAACCTDLYPGPSSAHAEEAGAAVALSGGSPSRCPAAVRCFLSGEKSEAAAAAEEAAKSSNASSSSSNSCSSSNSSSSRNSNNNSSSTMTPSSPVAAPPGTPCYPHVGETTRGATASSAWLRDSYAADAAATARPAGSRATIHSPAAAAARLPETSAADVKDGCCRGTSAALCPALSSFWSRVHALHIVDGGLSVPHVLFEISHAQLMARFQTTSCASPSSSATVATPTQFYPPVHHIVSDVAPKFSVASAQQQWCHHQLQTSTCCNSGQSGCSPCCCRTSPSSISTSTNINSRTPIDRSTCPPTSSTEGSTRDVGASTTNNSGSTSETSSSAGGSSSSLVTNTDVIRDTCRCLFLMEESDTCERRRAFSREGEVDVEREYTESTAADRHSTKVVRERDEADQCACSTRGDDVVKKKCEERAFQVTQQNREARDSKVEQRRGLKQIWVHCSSRQMFDGRRPFVRGETLGFLRALLRAAESCDATVRDGALDAVETTGGVKPYVRHTSTPPTTVGFARYYMPRFQRRALCLGYRGSVSVAAACEALAENTTESPLSKHVAPFSRHMEMEAAAQLAADTLADARVHNSAAHVELEAHKHAAAVAAPRAAGGLAAAPAALVDVLKNYQHEQEILQEAEAELFSCRVAVDPNFGLDVHFNLLSDATLALQLSSAWRHCSTTSKTAAAVSSSCAAAVSHEDVRSGDKGWMEAAPARNPTSTHGATEKHAVSVESNLAAAEDTSSKRRTPIPPFDEPVGQQVRVDGTAAPIAETGCSETYAEMHNDGVLQSERCFGNSRLLEVDIPVPRTLFFEEWRELCGTRFY